MPELSLETTVGRHVIQLVTNRALTGQKYHIRILDINRNVLLTSEKYRDRGHAERMMRRFVEAFGG